MLIEGHYHTVAAERRVHEDNLKAVRGQRDVEGAKYCSLSQAGVELVNISRGLQLLTLQAASHLQFVYSRAGTRNLGKIKAFH